jgi:arylsulfatase A-like enzyme
MFSLWALSTLSVLEWAVFCQHFSSSPQPIDAKNSHPRPNIVLILTDDQDLHLNSLDYLPFVQKHLLDRGTVFTRHYCTVALRCPSRVTLWTGKHAHNTVRSSHAEQRRYIELT